MKDKVAGYWERRTEQRTSRHDQTLLKWRSRRYRRPLAVVLGIADVALVIAGTTFLLVPYWVFFTLWGSAVAVGAIALTLLRMLTGRMSAGPDRLLDEREREWRHRISFYGYSALVGLMIAAMAYCMFTAGLPDPGHRDGMALSTLIVAGVTVPPIALGWLLPDDDPADFEEGEENV